MDEDYEDQREVIASDIAEYMNCPSDAVTNEQINEWEKRGWSIHNGSPYCLFCGVGIKAELKDMSQRKFCGFCRASFGKP